jgi:hypothetical protein
MKFEFVDLLVHLIHQDGSIDSFDVNGESCDLMTLLGMLEHSGYICGEWCAFSNIVVIGLSKETKMFTNFYIGWDGLKALLKECGE